ncbi:MAG TPA: Dabb family protein [Gemmataceae bacterium]|nr:Dabb family protein [Gemmataceae bacterium]
MRRQSGDTLALDSILGGLFALNTHPKTEAAMADEPMLVHNVYFSLKDNSAEAKKKMVDACKKFLTKHPGEVFFATGTLAEELHRPVNDRDFEIGLHVVFKNKAAHDEYQDSARHKQFIEENRDNWKKVRVFDSVVDKQ